MFLLQLRHDHVPELQLIGIQVLVEFEGILAENALF